METDSQAVNDWLIKNMRLVHWTANRLAWITRKMTHQRVQYEEVLGYVMEGMWKAWPRFDGRAKLSTFMTFCGRQYAIGMINADLRRRGRERLPSLQWAEEKTAIRTNHKSNSNGRNRYVGMMDPAGRELPPLQAEVEEYDRIDTEVALSYALGTIPQSHQAILIRRAVNEESLQKIGKSYGVTKERIRQKETKAITWARERFTKVRDW